VITKHFKEFYQSANQLTSKRFSILKVTYATFASARASQAAASLAYYAIFSLFPLMLALIAAGSYFLDSKQVYQSVTSFVQNIFPVSRGLVAENLQKIIDARGAVGAISLATLLWSASNVFINLAYDINLAWPEASHRSFLQTRLIGLKMIAGLSLLLLFSVLFSWMTTLIPFLHPSNAAPQTLSLLTIISNIGAWLTVFLLYLAMYYWVPTVDVSRGASVFAALVASIGWQLATAGFNLYLNSGLANYQLIYGSVGAIIALLFLIFLVALITLFGAHLCAAIDRWQKDRTTNLTNHATHYSERRP
jgi:membrane protein